MGRIAYVEVLPKCDFCGKPARYDAKTIHNGAWAEMCEVHYHSYGIGLGTGLGQKLILMPPAVAKLPPGAIEKRG